MTVERVRPARVADEVTQLVGWLDLQRALVPWKCEGLGDEDAYRVVLPSSPLMTMAGLVSHLRWTEHCWYQVVLAGVEEDLNPQFREDEDDADWTVEGVPLADLLAAYEAECRRSNQAIAARSLDDLAVHPRHGGSSLRWITQHMLEETARHVGHADVIRELLDGSRGYW